MAILSLCLVAIFALVQSIPLTPTTQEAQDTAAAETVSQAETKPPQEAQPVAEIRLVRPIPERSRVRNEHVVLQRPKPATVQRIIPAPVDVSPETTVAAAEPVEEGFTLRFETDAALTRLVAQHVVGLYAMTPEKSLRMNIDGDEISFWPASVPGQFHEMDQFTVPDDVLAAFGRSNPLTDIKWGVTLPAGMSQDLNGYLASASGGALVIAANGEVSLGR